MKKRALISVSDKTGLLDFAAALARLDYEIVSTGGTYKAIKEAGIPVTYVTEVTGFPEILDGRVKTLNPYIHGGILAMRTPEHLAQLKEHAITPIDIVAVNLYPFRQTVAKPDVTLEDAIENIDIGGPTMVRSAAKNHKYVAIVVDPARYPELIEKLEKGEMDEAYRFDLARAAFRHTAEYDAYISRYLDNLEPKAPKFPTGLVLPGEKVMDLRYGENPHQTAAFYRMSDAMKSSIANAKQYGGKELSFNNIVDINAALELVREFDKPACVIVKHTNPCGTATGTDMQDAYTKAFAADPVSAFGGIVALNREVDELCAHELVKTFLEAVIAPAYSPKALAILAGKKNLRVMETGELEPATAYMDIKRVNGGFLVQDSDAKTVTEADLRCVTKRQPTEAEIAELLFAWKIVKHTKSNAIVVTKDNQSLGVGAGQMNRVGSAEIAFKQGGEKCKGAVLASDAFFPFRDTIDAAAAAGITAIIQPGGSIRDDESILAADEHGIAMVFTDFRHFKH